MPRRGTPALKKTFYRVSKLALHGGDSVTLVIDDDPVPDLV